MKKHIAILLTTAALNAGGTVSSAALADDLTPVWQYELGFHGRHIESNLYLSYHTGPRAYAAATGFVDSAPIRTTTLFQQSQPGIRSPAVVIVNG